MGGLTVPSDDEAREATDAAKRLSPLVMPRGKQSPRQIRVRAAGGDETVPVPDSAFRLFVQLLELMSKGSALSVVAVNAELTTQQAADLLNVSRPFLLGLLDERTIPFRGEGNGRRVLLRDLVAFKERDDRLRREVADRLTAEAQDLDLDY